MRSHRAALASLASHSIGNVSYRLATLALVAIYAARLGPDAFGKLEQLLAVSMLLVPLVSWQVQEAFLAVYPKAPEKATQAASSLVVAAMLLVVIAAAVIYLSGVVDRALVLLLGLHVVTTIGWQFARNVVRNLQLLRHLLAAELGQTLAMLGSGLALLRAGAGYEGAVLAIAFGNVAALAVALAAKAGMLGLLNPAAPSMLVARQVVVVAGKLLPNVLFWWVVELSDRLLIAYYLGDGAVGIYSAGARLAGMGMAACLLIYQAWQVAAIRALDAGPDTPYFAITLPWFGTAVALLFSGLLCILAPLGSLLFGEDFSASPGLAAALVPGLYVAAFCYFYGVVLYVPGGAVSAWRASFAGVVASVSTNVLLLPRYGPYVAALASLLAFSTILAIRLREARGLIDARLTLGNFFAPLTIILAQAASVVSGLGPPVTAVGFLLLMWLRRHDILPFLRSTSAMFWLKR